MDDELAVGGYKPHEEGTEVASLRSEGLNRVYSIATAQGYEANDLLSDPQNNHKKIVQISHFYSDKIGILKSALRVYATFTYGDIKLEGGIQKNRNFFDKFIKQVKLNKVLRQSISDIYKSGDFFWYRERSKGKTVWIHQLNPVDVEMRGHKRDRPVADLATNNDPETLPDDLNLGKDGRYSMPPIQLYQVSLDREGYLRYGKPITTAAFESIQHIQELMDMEKESIDSVIESLIIFTIGDEKRPAGKQQIDDLNKAVKSLKSTSRIVGNHTLKAAVIEKNIGVFSPDKFEVPLKQLMYSIGITPSIFTGEGSYATASAGMASAKKTIEMVRTEIEETLEQLFFDVALENGLNPEKNPIATLGNLDLNDEKVQHAIIRDLYLDGIISAETYASIHGQDLDAEQVKIAQEEKDYNVEPRQMSSTLSNKSDGRPPDPQTKDTPNSDKKPSTDQ